MRRNAQLSILALSLLGLLALPSGLRAAPVQNLPPAAAALREFAVKNNIPNYVRTCANGSKRVCLNVSGWEHLQAVQNYLRPGCNVLEVCHFDPYHNPQGGVLMHTLGIFDRQGPHFQTPDGFAHWRLNDWGGGNLYAGRNPIFSALIQLDQTEGDNLRANIKLAREEQAAGGVIKTAFGLGQRGGNCASIWSDAPIGKNRETLGQLTGVGSNGSPHGLQESLEDRANDKVFGVIQYGPKAENWGANPDAPIFGTYLRNRH